MINIIRWHKPQAIPLENRTCPHCGENQIENEFHHVMSCKAYDDLRRLYISNKYNKDQSGFLELLKSENKTEIQKMGHYLLAAKHRRNE